MFQFIFSLLLISGVQSFASTESVETQEFKEGLQNFNKEKYEKAIENFSKAINVSRVLKDYSLFYRARSLMALKNWSEAEKDLLQIDSQPIHFKIQLESRLMLAQVYFATSQPAKVKPLFSRFLRRVKRTEDEPQVLLTLARADRLSQAGRGCQYLRELYTRFPDYPDVKHWDADLDKNEFLGEPTYCSYTTDQFRDRIRALLWAGLDQKAFSEMILVSGRMKDSDPVLSDVIRSQFHLQEGDVRKAYDLLVPHVEKKLNDPQFLLNFASTASRAGESSVAMGTYLHVAKTQGRNKHAQRALFLSSVLSYQFQDYDGAEKRFQEFIKLYPRTSLASESRWHLAWLDYLRGDYERAISRFQELIKKNSRSTANLQKYQYWLAVSYIKLARYNKAQPLLTRLTQDPLRGYYSTAADSRLNELKQAKSKIRVQPAQTRWNFSEMMMPSMDSLFVQAEEVDDEESYTASVIDEEERELTEGAQEVAKEEAEKDAELTEIKTPKLAERFEAANILKSLGLNDWAKWENYSIEQKTKNKDYLKTLIAAYEGLEQYHRSSQIAHLRFISERSQLGFQQGAALWASAYPRAYLKNVEKWSSKNSVASEFIWSIMKQESQFKRDAISPVGALGLMQVMPMTGYRMSRIQGVDDFNPQQLLEPDRAVEMGSAYLSRLLKKFNGQQGLVAAAYNAGPHRADLWFFSFGHLSVDEFIEHIPFAETRNYVKKVLNNQQIYREFYRKEKRTITAFEVPFDYKLKGPVSHKEDWESP